MLSWNNYYKDYAAIDRAVYDEQHHIPSAEKYLERIAYLDAHPPLGKMIIALGEKWLSPNQKIDKSVFWDKAQVKHFPKGLDYSGFRLMPVVSSVLTGVLFLLLFYLISGQVLLSTLFALFYVFENSFIVHSRVGTFDSIQVFFMMATVTYFVCVFKQKGNVSLCKYGLLAVGVGLCFSVKLTGLICILLIIPLFVRERHYCIKKFSLLSKANKRKLLIDLSRKAIVVFLCFSAVVCTVFYIHICLGERHITTQQHKLPKKYVKIIESGRQKSLVNFPYMFKENLKFISKYQDTVSGLSGSRTEVGSHPLIWPLGGKAPVYMQIFNNGKVFNLYPVGNPVVWWSCLLGIFLTVVLVFSRVIYKLPVTNWFYFNIAAIMFVMYLSYMFVMMNLDRVMYFHHYYIPFFFSLIMSFAVFNYLFEKLIEKKDFVLNLSLVLLVAQVLICFYFFSPVTYMQEQTRYEFKQRMWMDVWGLRHAK